MNDREQKLRDLLSRRAKGFPSPSAVPPELLRRARRSMAVAAMVIVLAVSVVGYGAFASVRALRRQSVPVVTPSEPTPSPSPSPSVTPEPPPSEIAIPGTNLVFPLAGSVDQIVIGSGALYAAYYPTGDFKNEVIARLDLQTRAVVRSLTLPGAISMALSTGPTAPNVLWVAHWNAETPPSRVLLGLDPTTLRVVVEDVVLSIQPYQLIAEPGGLWVGGGTQIGLFSLSSLRPITITTLDGAVGPMALDPTGQILYVATSDPAGSGPRSIFEIDAATGGTLKRVPGPIGILVSGVTTTTAGVWVSVSTGLMGTVLFYRASDLRQTVALNGNRGGPVTNSIDADFVGNILWVTDDMIGVLACVNPTSGHLRAVVIPQGAAGPGFSNVTGVGSTVFVGIAGGVLSIVPDSNCLP